jgi:hypothetical protein
VQVPTEIIAGLVTVWIALQLSMLKRIGKLETLVALNKQSLNSTERLLNDILQRYFHNRNPRSPRKHNLDPDNDFGSDDAGNGLDGA